MEQMLLFATEDEARLMSESPRFRVLSDDQRRFVVAWLSEAVSAGRVGDRLSVRRVAERAGIGKSKAYAMWRDGDILAAIREAGQLHSDWTDAVGSAALDVLVLQGARRIADGSLRLEDLTPTALRLLEGCKDRLGLVAGGSVTVRTPDGTEVSVGRDRDWLDDQLAQVRAATRLPSDGDRTGGGGGVRDGAESVHAVAGDALPVAGDALPVGGSSQLTDGEVTV